MRIDIDFVSSSLFQSTHQQIHISKSQRKSTQWCMTRFSRLIFSHNDEPHLMQTNDVVRRSCEEVGLVLAGDLFGNSQLMMRSQKVSYISTVHPQYLCHSSSLKFKSISAVSWCTNNWCSSRPCSLQFFSIELTALRCHGTTYFHFLASWFLHLEQIKSSGSHPITILW